MEGYYIPKIVGQEFALINLNQPVYMYDRINGMLMVAGSSAIRKYVDSESSFLDQTMIKESHIIHTRSTHKICQTFYDLPYIYLYEIYG